MPETFIEIRMKKIAVFAYIFLIIGCSKEPEHAKEAPIQIITQKPEPILFPISEIAGKSKAETEKIIGKAVSCEHTKYGDECTYTKADAQIVFINGKADWITVNKMSEVPYQASALKFIGIAETDPTFSNLNVIRWENIPGYLEIEVFPAGSKVFYAYIKVTTK